MANILRPYQSRAFSLISEHFQKKEKKILLVMPTGAGKTVIFCQLLKKVYEKGKRAIMVVRGRKLVKQAADRLKREEVPFSVCMAGEKDYDESRLIQICSIDTLYARQLILPADLIVIDEAHLASSSSYEWLIKNYSNCFILGVTATPYMGKSLRHIADHVVVPITMNELIGQKYLVAPRYFSIQEPDLTGVDKVTTSFGMDFNSKQVDEVVNQKGILVDLVQKWIKLAKNRQTIVFACSVAHSQNLTSQFIDNGYNAQHVDANTPDYLREYYFEKFQNKQIQILVNCNILALGVDLPICDCILMARPTDSLALYIQQAGRGTRTYPGKDDFLILDCAGNVLRHGFITQNHEINLDGKKPKTDGLKIRRCPECLCVFQNPPCPNCGHQHETKSKSDIKEIDGELVEIKNDINRQVLLFNRELMETQKTKGYKKAWCYFKLKEKFGIEFAQKYYPGFHSYFTVIKK